MAGEVGPAVSLDGWCPPGPRHSSSYTQGHSTLMVRFIEGFHHSTRPGNLTGISQHPKFTKNGQTMECESGKTYKEYPTGLLGGEE